MNGYSKLPPPVIGVGGRGGGRCGEGSEELSNIVNVANLLFLFS